MKTIKSEKRKSEDKTKHLKNLQQAIEDSNSKILAQAIQEMLKKDKHK